MEFKLPKQCIADCSHMGPCDDDVARWLKDRRIKKIMREIPDDVLSNHLKGFGAWDAEELSDRKANEMRLLWVAAGYCQDNDDLWYVS